MAYIIFKKNDELSARSMYKIAENDEHLNNLNIIKSDYIIKTISNTDFDNLKQNTKNVSSVDGDVISFIDIPLKDPIDKTMFDQIIIKEKDQANEWIQNPNIPSFFRTLAQQYLNTLNNLNSDNISFPLNQNFFQYLHSQSLMYIKPLQIG